MAAYGEFLAREHPGYELVDMAPLARHYFAEIGVRMSTRLHDEPGECAAARLARLKCDGPPPPHAGSGGSDADVTSAARLRITMIEGCGGCGQVSATAQSRGVTIVKGVENDLTARAVWKLRFSDDAELDHDVLDADTWRGMAAEVKESVTAIFGGWPCPVFSRANPDARGGDDPRAWIFYCATHAVLSDPHFNYQQKGKLLSLSGENVVGKEE